MYADYSFYQEVFHGDVLTEDTAVKWLSRASDELDCLTFGRLSFAFPEKDYHGVCFWPISVFINNRAKATEARQWNEEHAEIEVKEIKNMAEVAAYFREKADGLRGCIKREIWDVGEDSECVKKDRKILAHYEEVARSISSAAGQMEGES